MIQQKRYQDERNSMIMFPNEFCDSYIHNIDDWWTSKEYADKLYSNFMKLQLKEPKEDMIRIVFSSKKLGKEAIMPSCLFLLPCMRRCTH